MTDTNRVVCDYIIVGAGSAGCVLASRLSEDPKVTVAVLEAGGPDRRQEIRIPAAFAKLFRSDCDWAYTTEEQPALAGRRLYWPRGKVIGGSSSTNAMIYIRGDARDYDEWHHSLHSGAAAPQAESGGTAAVAAPAKTAWTFEALLPYFRRAENQERGASEYHGAGGPLSVTDLRYINPLSRAFVDAAVETGLPRNPDFNGPVQEGAGFYQVTHKRGQRCSAADGYLKPAMKRPNLTVLSQAHTTHVTIDNGRATGVVYVHNGRKCEAIAHREVILCGGAVNSPQLLMLSGIGSAAHLERMGVRPIVDLPGVGENLQDHLAVVVAHESKQAVTLAGAESIGNIARYLLFRRGMLASNVGEAGAFVKTSPGLERCDVQVLFAPVWYIEHGFTKPQGIGYTVGAVLLRPQSRGSIRLHSADPLAAPAIQPNYCSEAQDMATLVEAVKRLRAIAAAHAFAPYRGPERYPGPEVQSVADTEAYIRRIAETLYHPVGTCRMGRDAMAVVDTELRVHGVQGLRVVDASVMPSIVGGNTNAPTIAIAERAADLLRDD